MSLFKKKLPCGRNKSISDCKNYCSKQIPECGGEKNMKTEKEIKQELKEICTHIKTIDNFDSINIYQGWIEALAFVLNIEMCNCGYFPVEDGYNQCTICLDKADNEKRRHENE